MAGNEEEQQAIVNKFRQASLFIQLELIIYDIQELFYIYLISLGYSSIVIFAKLSK